MTSNNETASWQNAWAGNIAKSMMSEGNSTLRPMNVDQQPPLQPGLMNFKLQNFRLYNKSLKDWSLGKQLILFRLNLNVSFGSALGNLEILVKVKNSSPKSLSADCQYTVGRQYTNS